MKSSRLAAVCVLLLLVVGIGRASATPPGGDGLILFRAQLNGSDNGWHAVYDDGTGLKLMPQPDGFEVIYHMAWSPDGTRVAFSGISTADGCEGIWVINADGTGLAPWTPDPGAGACGGGTAPSYDWPTWRSSSLLAFQRDESGSPSEVYESQAGDDPTALTDPSGSNPAASSTGELAYIAPNQNGAPALYVLGTGEIVGPEKGGASPDANSGMDWSPDGSKILFTGQNSSGIWEVNADGTGLTRLQTCPCWDPVFSPDGTEYAYVNNSSAPAVIDVAPVGGGTIRAIYGNPAISGLRWAIAPNQPPTASFTVTPSTGTRRATFAVNGTASSDPDDGIASYLWSFGDGATATGATAAHKYSKAGTFTITLTVTDHGGATDSTTHQVTVNDIPPVPSYRYTVHGRTVTFDAHDSYDIDGRIVSYAWHFGLGGSANGVTVTHTYPGMARTAYATLVVTDDTGGSASIKEWIPLG
jgi:PKD repeat protein